MDYKIYHYTNPNRKDSSRINGDYSLWKQLENGLVYLVAADGVGSTDKHWIASKMICELSLQNFIENEMNFRDIPQRLSYAIEKANNEIFAQGTGFLSTLCVGIFDNNNNDFFYTWIGDSRIYQIGNNCLQLTEDQTLNELIVENGKPKIIDGAPQFRTKITNAIGFEKIVYEIKKSKLNVDETLLMVTDGFYETRSIEDNLSTIINKRNFCKLFDALCLQVGDENIDDATILIFKLEDVNQDLTSKTIEKISSLLMGTERELLIFELNNLQMMCDITQGDFIKIMDDFSKAEKYNQDREIYQKILGFRSKLK